MFLFVGMYIFMYGLQHVDSLPDIYARILFVDHKPVFITIIPSILFRKIHNIGVPHSMCLWILGFMLNRPKVVKIGSNLSKSLTLSTCAPQGSVLSRIV